MVKSIIIINLDQTSPSRPRKLGAGDTIKRLMSYPKCRIVEVINNQVRSGSNHMKINYIKLQIINGKELKRTFEMIY
jgi:hypothetical protein